MSKIFKKTSMLSILALTLSLAFILNNSILAFAVEEEIVSSNEVRSFIHANIEEEFDDDCVIVVMDKQVGGINKQHDYSMFGNFAKKSVRDLTYITGDVKSKVFLDTENFHQILKIELQKKSKISVLNAVRELDKVDGILWAGPNYHDKPAAQPTSATGTLYPDLWGMHGKRGIQAEEAWNISTSVRNSVRVGIIDSGVANHPDLDANLVAGWDFFIIML